MDGTERRDDLDRCKIHDALTEMGACAWRELSEATGFRVDKLRRLTDHDWFTAENGVVRIVRIKGRQLVA